MLGGIASANTVDQLFNMVLQAVPQGNHAIIKRLSATELLHFMGCVHSPEGRMPDTALPSFNRDAGREHAQNVLDMEHCRRTQAMLQQLVEVTASTGSANCALTASKQMPALFKNMHGFSIYSRDGGLYFMASLTATNVWRDFIFKMAGLMHLHLLLAHELDLQVHPFTFTVNSLWVHNSELPCVKALL